MNIDLISPYHGGSHQSWANGYAKHSKNDVRLLTLPDRFWKWRMHGGAITLARRFLAQNHLPDLILATDMLDLTTFLALTRQQTAAIPTVLYMHENQLTYPLPQNGRFGPMRRQHGERDQHYVFINVASMLAANAVLFNSHYHRSSFLDALPNYLKHFPEYNELNAIDLIAQKSSVLPVGIEFDRLDLANEPPSPSEIPLIVWNQRWEYDKNPEGLFAALFQLAEAEIPFQLALCGQQYGKRPLIFEEAINRLDKQLIHVGFASGEQYKSLLWQSDITISTAIHEFFGISVLEAVYCHTFPILPNRLSYPEIVPDTFHKHCLYEDDAELVEKLKWALTHRQEIRKLALKLKTAVSQFNWQNMVHQYDHRLQKIVKS